MQRTPSTIELLRRRINSLSEEEAVEVLDYIAVMQSLKNGSDADPLDELMIRLLVEAHHSKQPTAAGRISSGRRGQTN